MGTGYCGSRDRGHGAGDAALTWSPDRRPRLGCRGLRIRGPALAFVLTFQALAVPVAAGTAAAQALATSCAADRATPYHRACPALAQGAAIAQSRLALAASGGSPLLGNSSTLGMRTGTTPRVAAQVRVSAVRLTMPRAGGAAGGSTLARSLDMDAAMGVLAGYSPAATIGGVGSVDLLASLGYLAEPGGGFTGSSSTGALGARVGILRESFNVPGISLSAIYRRSGGTTFGSLDTGDVALDHINDVSLRATVGKRVFALGTEVGLGWDHTSSNATIAPHCRGACTLVQENPLTGKLSQSRANGFVDLTWTSLVVNATLEVGWQRGGSPAALRPPTGFEDLVRRGAFFGSLGLRLTI